VWAKLLLVVWSGPDEPRARGIRIGLIDFFMLVLAIMFPWSTAVTTGLVLGILPMVWVTHGPREMVKELKRPACALPVAFVGLAIAGMMWANGAPWSDRLHALEKVLKLLWLPHFFLHFQKTDRAKSVFAAYVGSNLVLLVFSFFLFMHPDVSGFVKMREPGVPLKNYIDQSQGFAFIAVVCSALAAESFRERRVGRAIAFLASCVAFLTNLVVVNVARTAFFYVPAMLLVVGLRYARGWQFAAAILGMCILAVALWATSANLQSKIDRLSKEVGAFQTNSATVGEYTAGGAERLEMWRKSIGLIGSAPIMGHGTGSTRGLFATEAAGKTGLRAEIVDNPHNQTLAVGIQWGFVGCLLLYAMWGAHLCMFGGRQGPQSSLLALIGLLAVVQNVTSSVFNSHLFDFYEGWLYVLTVGIVGGQLQRKRSAAQNPRLNG
jgi:hypothetical protein